MFRAKQRLLGFRPANGQRLLVRARVGLYEPRGDFQLIVEHMEPAGDGLLRLRLEQLKQRLAAEGLFAEELKRPLPAYPRQVGLITSGTGAALHDLLTVLCRRFPLLPVIIYPSGVQGAGAAERLIDTIALANRRDDCDLLILARGGGSLEDLMAFNDEGLARAIRASALPVVTGIGHEVDLSIADLAADRRAPTPSAAAELAAPDAEQARRHLRWLDERLRVALKRELATASQRLMALRRQLQLLHPRTQLEQRLQRVDELQRRLQRALEQRIADAASRFARSQQRLRTGSPMQRLSLERVRTAQLTERLLRAAQRALEHQRERLSAAAAGLQARSPLATLARGYAIVTDAQGRLIRGPEQAPVGSAIQVRVSQGSLEAVVTGSAPA